jgi:hypothetical protein
MALIRTVIRLAFRTSKMPIALTLKPLQKTRPFVYFFPKGLASRLSIPNGGGLAAFLSVISALHRGDRGRLPCLILVELVTERGCVVPFHVSVLESLVGHKGHVF